MPDMPRNDERIPSRTRKLVFQEAHSRCAFCDESDVDALDICHIQSRANGGDNEAANLILACATCHRKIDSDQITLSKVREIKRRLMAESEMPVRRRERGRENVIEFHGRNTGYIANQITIKTARSVKLAPPNGIVGADADRRSYIKYLIDRYHKFKEREMGDAMDYRMIYAAITREFKCKWDFVPIHRFDELAAYLQRRIDSTIIGKVQKKRGGPNYSTFDEFMAASR